MNDNRVFMQKKAWMLFLLKLGMPSLVIQKVLDIALSTVVNYLAIFHKSGEWTKEILTITSAKPKMLKLYAEIMCGSCKSFTSAVFRKNFESKERQEFEEKIKIVLAEILEEEKILQTISYALPVIMSFSEIKYTNDIPAGYRGLIDRLWSTYEDSSSLESKIWKEYLHKIARSDIQLPETRQFFWGNHLVYSIIHPYAQKIREYYVAPIVTLRICSLIDETLEKLKPQEEEIIDLYFGLHAEEQSLETIGKKFSLSKERIHQIKNHAIVKLKRRLSDDLKPVSHAWEEKQALKDDIQEIKDRKDQQFLELDETYKKKLMELQTPEAAAIAETIDCTYNENLFLRIDDLDISPRAKHCFRAADIEYVWILVQFHPNDLLKFRNFGRKSLPRVEEIIAEKKLTWNMKFTPAQIAYFKAKTTGIETEQTH